MTSRAVLSARDQFGQAFPTPPFLPQRELLVSFNNIVGVQCDRDCEVGLARRQRCRILSGCTVIVIGVRTRPGFAGGRCGTILRLEQDGNVDISLRKKPRRRKGLHTRGRESFPKKTRDPFSARKVFHEP